MFPACAGMNRSPDDQPCENWRVPRMRGDEPIINGWIRVPGYVFPACAGMNRICMRIWEWASRVPRMRGDEPIIQIADEEVTVCSPHARG
ncbi:conserved protein of unknown function [Denitratisoma oestradiolicum]|uniref:Uncharacterized protein n=1 Tax=Denitratisoma oestradiolicum TaxID=311182 RepID=A0A6S6XYY0_9PROT|nr:conserved protein of unknown function [Denitratisoma oestradiolicum]